MRRVARILPLSALLLVALATLAAPFLAPNDVATQFGDYVYAPPMRIHVVDAEGRWHRPFIYPLRVANRLERRYEEDRSTRVPLAWFSGGRVIDVADPNARPLLLLGGDSLGRDVFARIVHGARMSLGVALLAVLGALAIGTLLGGLAGYAGGWIDESLMRLAEFVLVLPTMYVLLALRAVLPLVLPASVVFTLTAILLAIVGWPYATRGVRAIVAAERQRDYAAAAVALGAGRARVLLRHLLPAAGGFLVTQALLLMPAFILAEATLSFAGLGFAEPVPSWGTMLRDAAQPGTLADFPWLLAPAAAIVLVVLSLNVAAHLRRAPAPLPW
jgi:peptide/nickel transport system permease protein